MRGKMLHVYLFIYFLTIKITSSFSAINLCIVINVLNNKTIILLNQGGLAATFDLAAFRKAMIAPVKKSVNHSKTVMSMRESEGFMLFCLWRLRIRIKSLLLYC